MAAATPAIPLLLTLCLSGRTFVGPTLQSQSTYKDWDALPNRNGLCSLLFSTNQHGHEAHNPATTVGKNQALLERREI